MATMNMVCGAIVFLVGANIYSALIGTNYFQTFFYNPFNIMFLGLGVPAIMFGIAVDMGVWLNQRRGTTNENE